VARWDAKHFGLRRQSAAATALSIGRAREVGTSGLYRVRDQRTMLANFSAHALKFGWIKQPRRVPNEIIQHGLGFDFLDWQIFSRARCQHLARRIANFPFGFK
jgi:hypothetical protein